MSQISLNCVRKSYLKNEIDNLKEENDKGKKKNIIGIQTDPCGTPHFTFLHSEFSSLTTVISLPFR